MASRVVLRSVTGTLFALSLLGAPAFAADSWDTGTIKDNTATSTRNEIQRNDWQTHDLEAVGGVADEDWFVVATTSFRTYQIFLSQVTGDTPIDNADFLTLWDATGTTLLLTASAGPGATGKVLRWFSEGSIPGTNSGTSYRVRVKGNVGTTASAKYAILFSESTLYCPRYNNSGSQISVIIIQNTTNSTCNLSVGFFNAAGVFLNFKDESAPPAGMVVLPAGSVTNVNGTSGSVQIRPSCSPSALKAKVVALEPSTGFSFDTLCQLR